MEVAYYNLSGGINQAMTKTELGIDTKKVYWADSENVEILQNRGVVKQKGNTLFLQIGEKITGMSEISAYDENKLIITTQSGKIYIYDDKTSQKVLLSKTLTGKKPKFLNFLNGILIMTESDGLFYIKNNTNYDIVNCNLKDLSGNIIVEATMATYKGRVWVAKGATVYYSALGTYNDFTTADDAGYINEFHTNTGIITALKPYKDYLAIYKKNSVYLLSGTTPEDFAVTLFADKGAVTTENIVNVENKQYFLSGNGIFALEQVGELNQIQLGNEISLKIKEEFKSFVNLEKSFSLHYENKSQIWYFLPYRGKDYFYTIWINDYVNKAWYKRIVPQDIVTACVFDKYIYTADKDGNIYKEDFGTTFNGSPIKFMWKSPFLAITTPHHRKIIDEFYFLLDTEYDNNFKFSVFKDYDNKYSDDEEKIYSLHTEHLSWYDGENDEKYFNWPLDDEMFPVWSINKDTMEKAEISESNYSVQLCVTGNELTHSCAVIGLQFREIYNDD